MSVDELLAELEALGIRLWADDDRLRYDAPAGALTASLSAQVRARKEEILSFLSRDDTSASAALSPIAKVDRTGYMTPSFAQQRLWFLDQLTPDATHYNIVRAFHLTGPFEFTSLEAALNDIVRRHETLRTTFVSVRGAPAQRVGPVREVGLPIEDLGEVPAHARLATAKGIAAEEYQRPFKLHEGPLLRTKLLRLREEEHVLVLAIHHIVADGWSMGVLFQELAALYEARSRGRRASLAPLEVQYADFANWQQQWLRGEVLEGHLNYWREKLDDLPRLRLPTDRPRPSVQTFEGAREILQLPDGLSRQLRQLGLRDGATSFMTLLAVFAVLMHRYTGEDDVVVGSPFANRNRAEVEGLIGFFVNMLIMRVDLSDHPTYREVLARVKEWTLDAYEHQDLPFERLVEELEPERDAGSNPLFQVTFAVQNAPREGRELGGLKLEVLRLEACTTRFDLEVHVWEDDAGLAVWFVYNSDLFDAATIQRMMAHFGRLLEAVVEHPDQPVRELQFLSESERNRLLLEWNDTVRPYPRDKCIGELFEEQVECSPNAIALECEGQQLTYAELNRRANRLANRLVAMDVGSEVMVGLCVERSVEMIVAMLGILKAGGGYVPLDPSHPSSRLRFTLEDTAAPVLVTTRSLRAQLPEYSGRVLFVDESDSEEPSVPETNPSVAVGPENLAYVIYTSGSTGTPKGTCIEHRSVVRLVKSANYVEIDPSDVFLQFAPISFDASTFEVWGALLNGAKLVVQPPGVPSLEELGESIRKNEVSILWLTATLFHQMVDGQLESLRGVRQLLAGGEALSVSHVRRMLEALKDGHRLINGYGPTENTTFTACHVMTSASRVELSVPIGRPISNTRIYILDAEMKLAPDGVAGELFAGGDGLAREYLNRRKLTDEKFVENPFGEGRLYRTGDMARYLADGSIEFLGRVDHQVKLRGYRIELGEVESVLGQLATVKECVVSVQKGAGGDDRLMAYVVPNDVHADANDELRSVDQVSQWQTTYEQLYGETLVALEDPTFDIVGWNSSYTGDPFPEAVMREWVAAIVARIQAFRPRRVLEIGCGTGLILFQVAPACERYTGTDFSEATIGRVRELASEREELAHLECWHRRADNFDGVGRGDYDTVVLSSVVQYWPSADYLGRVLEGALDATAAGGRIFIGDVRSLPLLEAFHACVQLHRSGPSMSAGELSRRILSDVARENELVVDPAFFDAFKSCHPRIGEVEILLKRGRDENEMTQFRYDVVLHVEATHADLQNSSWLDWRSENLNLPRLRDLLARNTADVVALSGIPNARLTQYVRLVDWSHEASESQRVSDSPEASSAIDGAVQPCSIWDVGEAMGYDVELRYSRNGKLDHMDALFRRNGGRARVPKSATTQEQTLQAEPWSRFTNDPLSTRRVTELSVQLREHAKTQMPDYMVPSAFVLLDALPLSPNGKVDREALPNPEPDRIGVDNEYVVARTEVESRIVAIWRDVVGAATVGTRDNFFDLGGHSLMATQVVSRIREAFDVELSLADFFERPTVAQLAEFVENARWFRESRPGDAHVQQGPHDVGQL